MNTHFVIVGYMLAIGINSIAAGLNKAWLGMDVAMQWGGKDIWSGK